MPRCRSCGRTYPDWQERCPACGAVPPKRSNRTTFWVAAVGIVAVVFISYYLFFIGVGGTGGSIMPNNTPPAIGQTHCTAGLVQISATKLPGGKISLTVMGNASANRVHHFRIRVNNVESDAILGLDAGSTVTVSGTSGSDHLIIVANSTCGDETTALDKTL